MMTDKDGRPWIVEHFEEPQNQEGLLDTVAGVLGKTVKDLRNDQLVSVCQSLSTKDRETQRNFLDYLAKAYYYGLTDTEYDPLDTLLPENLLDEWVPVLEWAYKESMTAKVVSDAVEYWRDRCTGKSTEHMKDASVEELYHRREFNLERAVARLSSKLVAQHRDPGRLRVRLDLGEISAVLARSTEQDRKKFLGVMRTAYRAGRRDEECRSSRGFKTGNYPDWALVLETVYKQGHSDFRGHMDSVRESNEAQEQLGKL